MKKRQRTKAQEHLSDFERAICYYTLPRVTHPVTYGLVVAYCVCLVEAAGALGYGMATGHPIWFRVGKYAFIGIVLLGIGIFLVRCFLNELKERRVLAQARGVPDAHREADDLPPNPFRDHCLVRCPRAIRGRSFECTNDAGKLLYKVEVSPRDDWWKLTDAKGEEILRVRAAHVPRLRFGIERGLPTHLTVYSGNEELAQIRRRPSLTARTSDVFCSGPEPRRYVIRHRSVYTDDRLVGRIYYLRDYLYLDIEEAHCHKAILGFFVALAA